MTPKQKRFCEEYIVDLNARKAAERAGYSKKTAAEIGCQNLIKLNIQQEIEKLQNERSQRTGITADKVLQELAAIGFSNISDYLSFGPRGVILNEDVPREKLSAVSEVSETVGKYGSSLKFKLHDKLNALDKIARHLGGFYKDKEEEEDPNSDRITEIKKTIIYKPKDDA